jgi:phage terminase Nu1 subunit (DNA packaging protein)
MPMRFMNIVTALTGEGLMAKNTGGSGRPSRQAIAWLAYHLFEERGREGGRDVEDWTLAEQQLTRHFEGAA